MSKYRSFGLRTVLSVAALFVLSACSSDSEEAPPPESSSGGGGQSQAEIEMCMELCRGDAACKQDCQQ